VVVGGGGWLVGRERGRGRGEGREAGRAACFPFFSLFIYFHSLYVRCSEYLR